MTINYITFGASPFIENTPHWNWNAVGAVSTSIAALLTLITLVTIWVQSHREKKYNRSESYLTQIKIYLNKGVSLLSYKNNNNIRWHQAIDNLKTADLLKEKLTDSTHKYIYLIELINFSYEIIETVKKIKDFKFFYGIEGYEDKDSTTLYQKSFSKEMEYCHRISPESLLSLCLFLDKISKMHYDLNTNKSSCEKIFKEKYFNLNINEGKIADLTEFTKKDVKILLDFISDFDKQNKN